LLKVDRTLLVLEGRWVNKKEQKTMKGGENEYWYGFWGDGPHKWEEKTNKT